MGLTHSFESFSPACVQHDQNTSGKCMIPRQFVQHMSLLTSTSTSSAATLCYQPHRRTCRLVGLTPLTRTTRADHIRPEATCSSESPPSAAAGAAAEGAAEASPGPGVAVEPSCSWSPPLISKLQSGEAHVV